MYEETSPAAIERAIDPKLSPMQRVYEKYTYRQPHGIPGDQLGQFCVIKRYCAEYVVANYASGWDIYLRSMVERHLLIFLCLVWLVRMPGIFPLLFLLILFYSGVSFLLSDEIYQYLHPRDCECPQHKLR